MASRTAIAQLVAYRLGVSELITNVDTQQTEIAIAIKGVFDQERDAVLRSLSWPWATAYATLALVAGTSAVAANGDWQYSYRWPSDCLLARRLVLAGNRTSELRPVFAIGRDGSGRLIYTDEADAELQYTIRVTDANEFDPLFVSMLAWKIAATVAPSRSQVKDMALIAGQMFIREWQIAGAAALNEGQRDPALDAEVIRARG